MGSKSRDGDVRIDVQVNSDEACRRLECIQAAAMKTARMLQVLEKRLDTISTKAARALGSSRPSRARRN